MKKSQLNKLNNLKNSLNKESSKFEEFVIDTLIENSYGYDTIEPVLKDYLDLENGCVSELIYDDDYVSMYDKNAQDIHYIIANNEESNTVNIKTDTFQDIVLFKIDCVKLAWSQVIRNIENVFDI